MLVERLRQDAQAAIDAVWHDAHAAAETARADGVRRCEDARTQAARDAARAAAELERAAVAAAEREARRIRTAAKADLADRLWRAAVATLPQFRGDRYAELFDLLALELPPLDYDEVIVNPQDGTLARARFPRARGVADANIVGGLDATADSGRVRISNTLATRLDAAWPSILPSLMRELLEGIDVD